MIRLHHRRYAVHTAAMAAFALLATPLAAGQKCLLTGRLEDARRHAVGTAIVTVTRIGSGAKQAVLSNGEGVFLLSLPPGTYQIDAVKPGFKHLSRADVEVGAGSAASVDLQMEDAEPAERVSLSAHKTGTGSWLIDVGWPTALSDLESLDFAAVADYF